MIPVSARLDILNEVFNFHSGNKLKFVIEITRMKRTRRKIKKHTQTQNYSK